MPSFWYETMLLMSPFLHRIFSFSWVAVNGNWMFFFLLLHYDSFRKCRSSDKWTATWEILEPMGAILAPLFSIKGQFNVPLPRSRHSPHISLKRPQWIVQGNIISSEMKERPLCPKRNAATCLWMMFISNKIILLSLNCLCMCDIWTNVLKRCL